MTQGVCSYIRADSVRRSNVGRVLVLNTPCLAADGHRAEVLGRVAPPCAYVNHTLDPRLLSRMASYDVACMAWQTETEGDAILRSTVDVASGGEAGGGDGANLRRA